MKMSLEFEHKAGDGYDLIERAACVLNAAGKRDEAKEVHQVAAVRDYDFYFALKILKEFGLT